MFSFAKISAVVQIDIHHLPIVLIIGLAIFFGTIGARIFQKLRIPQVVGYIIIGLIIGQSFLGIIGPETIAYMRSFNLFALGIIGFMIGGELKYAEFKKHGKQFFTILLAESLFAFIIVATIISIAATLILGDWKLGLALGLVLGAISSATAPAATVDVLWEYKCRGILTRTVLAIVALDDGFALLLFGFAGSAAGVLTGNTSHGLLMSILLPLYEIFGAIAIGIGTGAILIFALKFISEEEKVHRFEGPLGNAVILVVTTTTFLVQLIGPSCVKAGLTRAGEVGLNITEDDLINEYKVSDVMEPALDKTTKETPLRQAVDRINRYNLEHLCIISNETDQKLLGVLHYRTIKRRISTEILRRKEIADGTALQANS